MSEPEGVTLEDGQKLRHDEVWLVLDDGRVRELRLRVGRGVGRDVPGRTHRVGPLDVEGFAPIPCPACDTVIHMKYLDREITGAEPQPQLPPDREEP